VNVDARQTALMLFLRVEDPELYGKALELRDIVGNWLGYIPQTFPHYTRHTLPHSEAVILQASKLMFRNGDPAQVIPKISGMEAYILCAAAYLHDAGMVVSDQEKARILESAPWSEWVTGGHPGARRWAEIEAFRGGTAPADARLRNFLADVQLRFLIAEFVRRHHHLRVEGLLTENQQEFARFAFDDPLLLGTICATCVAHGLDRQALEDRDRFPERRTIRGQEVNVRFLAILLRLSDLLDLSTDRACPLLLNAACPLPAHSLAHWTQYQRLTHFLASPDTIEITALCKTQEEHRTIRDWCNWLVDEASNATVLMARSARHGSWQAPRASMDCPGATIKVEPATDAPYIPSNWRFELDQELVYRRLIEDLYTQPLSFVRELIQNALDAVRCQLYLALKADGSEIHEFPTQAPEHVRRRYVIRLALETQTLKNPLSDESEERQVLVIDDPGIGMDRDIIERCLLQVGRSYYATAEFQRNFPFVPASRFGLGFLSVFAVSDHVTIETLKPTSTAAALRVVLTGPRNYILLERGSRRTSGTRIEVRLREPIEPQALTSAVRNWCRRVEFPIIVDELGVEATIQAERKEQFLYEIPDVMDERARLAVRAFDIQRHGLEGELYVFARVDDRGESWDAWRLAAHDYPQRDPRASRPPFPGSLTCIHGISVGQTTGSGPRGQRIDFRGGDIPTPGLSRDEIRARGDARTRRDDRMTSRWEEVLTMHLSSSIKANSPEGWRYKQALVDDFPLESYWASLPGTIPTHRAGDLELLSLDELRQIALIATIFVPQVLIPGIGAASDRKWMPNPHWSERIPAVFGDELEAISNAHRRDILRGRAPASAQWLPTGHLAVNWMKHAGAVAFGGPEYQPSHLVELPDNFHVGFQIRPTGDKILGSILLNSRSHLVRWLVSVREASGEGASGIPPERYESLYEKFHEVCAWPHKLADLVDYIEKWSRATEFPSRLRPPRSTLLPAQFIRAPGPERTGG
jgi:hypothetical protein